MGSLAKALQIKEITIDGNPVTLNADYISFLVSYLPNLQLLSTMQISEQIRRTAMAWRFSKEQSHSAFLDLSTQVCMNVRREEVISNAKINWEFLRSRSKVSTDNLHKTANNNNNNNKGGGINVLHVQNPNKFSAVKPKSLDKSKAKGFGSLTSINENVEARKINIKKRSSSSDNLFKLDDMSRSYPLEFKLPPILGSIVDSLTSDKFEERLSKENTGKAKILSDIENISDSDLDSSESHESLKSGLRCRLFPSNSCSSSVDCDKSAISKKFAIAKDVSSIGMDNLHGEDNGKQGHDKTVLSAMRKPLKYYDTVTSENKSLNSRLLQNMKVFCNQDGQSDCQSKSTISSSGYCSLSSKASSLDSCKSLLSDSSTSSIPKNTVAHKLHDCDKEKGRIKSAQLKKVVYYKSNRAATARAKFKALAPPSPPPQQTAPKEREQGRLLSSVPSSFFRTRGIPFLEYVRYVMGCSFRRGLFNRDRWSMLEHLRPRRLALHR